jgi:hypothetical protein
MFIQRFLERRRIKRLHRQMRERIVLVVILGIFLLNWCLCMAFGLVDTALREIGILPTYTPSPPVTPEPTEAQVQGRLYPESLEYLLKILG